MNIWEFQLIKLIVQHPIGDFYTIYEKTCPAILSLIALMYEELKFILKKLREKCIRSVVILVTKF
jgi:hypothetical protein